jgi:transcriptional regulator with XRE-family HTH domain
MAQESIKQQFGQRLSTFLVQRGWTQSELARRAGLGRDAISTYVRGTAHPEPQNLLKIAKALGVDPTALFNGSHLQQRQLIDESILEISQQAGSHDKVVLHIRQVVSRDVAAKIMALL